jgi:hypothetical protein
VTAILPAALRPSYLKMVVNDNVTFSQRSTNWSKHTKSSSNVYTDVILPWMF